MKKYIVVIDQGTTSSRVLLINRKAEIIDKDYIEISKKEFASGEILQNPVEILTSVQELLSRLFKRNNLSAKEVDSIGITNQRETTVIWNEETGLPVYDAISWQANVTKKITDEWINKGYKDLVYEKTGLLINPYFSASKIRYILDKVNNQNHLLFGTIDSYLLYNLSVEKNHLTDISNASRTMLFNIDTQEWDDELLNIFNIPSDILPKVVANDHLFGHYEYNKELIPIYAMIGDQQGALFGHLCTKKGEAKITYGTGCFILVNTGDERFVSKNGLLTTVAWKVNGDLQYAIEGSVFMGGAAIKWMRDKLNLVNHAFETEKMAEESVNDNVYVVPAFAGFGAPYWDNEVKASILGLEANTTKADIMKATLNSIAYQVTDVLKIIVDDLSVPLKQIAVDGGASNNNYLMKFQADLINVKLLQNIESEVTGLGAGFIAGLKSGFWKSIEEIQKLQKIKRIFIPTSIRSSINKQYQKWLDAVKVTRMFK
ncbi:MAG: glycerol kinase GlpK [Acholeplasma sp.]|nr:glycerol kinase GlpK [Acholeplasma sp.]